MMVKVVCPECGKEDMVQKVSAIYSGGVSTISYKEPVIINTDEGPIHSDVERTEIKLTNLAKRLAPPSEPVSGRIGCITVLIAGILVGGFMDMLSAFQSLFFILILPIVLCGIYYKFYYAPAEKIYKEKLKPEWDIAKQKWSGLYYCYRNDCVFDPANDKSVSPERINTLLY